MTTSLERLLRPRSVAIVGLSADPRKHGARILDNLRRFEFAGDIWGVNARGGVIHGIETVPTAADLPGSPDVVVFAIPGEAIPAALRDCAEVGAGGGIVLGGGFAEAGDDGVRRQEQVATLARDRGIRLLGPNSAGVIDSHRRTVLSFLTCLDRAPEQLRAGPVALVSQSGGSASYLQNLAGERGGGFAVSISTGNEADLGAGEVLGSVIERDDVRAVALVLETVRDGRAFLAACRRALELGKPVVVCKVGTSDAGASMMKSHTGALATEWRRFEAVFDALGVTVARSPEELFDVAELMARSRIPRGPGVGVVTHSGGTAVLLADRFEDEGVELPAPPSTLRAELQPLLQLGTPSNPTDLGGIITAPHRYGEVVSLFLDEPGFRAVVEVSTPHPVSDTADRVATLIELSRTRDTPLIHLWLGGDLHRAGLERLREAGRPVSTHVDSVVLAVGGLGRLADRRRVGGSDRAPAPHPHALAALAALSPSPEGLLSEADSAEVVAALGIPVARHRIARTPDEARRAADALGYPVVVKLLAAELVHKSDAGGVRLDLRDGDAVLAACAAIEAAAEEHGLAAGMEGFLVGEYIPGLEVILGVSPDATFGPFVVVGLGGVLAEVMDDVVIALAPVTIEAAGRMIASLRGRRLLQGFRGAEPADEGALAELIVRLSLAAVEFEGVIAEVDINPVVWSGGRWRAADAVVRLAR